MGEASTASDREAGAGEGGSVLHPRLGLRIKPGKTENLHPGSREREGNVINRVDACKGVQQIEVTRTTIP